MPDPIEALDFDLALAVRRDHQERETVDGVMDQDRSGLASILTLLMLKL